MNFFHEFFYTQINSKKLYESRVVLRLTFQRATYVWWINPIFFNKKKHINRKLLIKLTHKINYTLKLIFPTNLKIESSKKSLPNSQTLSVFDFREIFHASSNSTVLPDTAQNDKKIARNILFGLISEFVRFTCKGGNCKNMQIRKFSMRRDDTFAVFDSSTICRPNER